MKFQAYGAGRPAHYARSLTLAHIAAGTTPVLETFDSFCLGPFVGHHPVRLHLDGSSDFVRKYGLLVAVADAAPDGGKVPASQIILEELASRFYAWDRKGEDAMAMRRSVGVNLDDANQALLSRLADEERVTASTTLAGFALFDPDVAIIFHIGDCRVYRDSSTYLRQLTNDHIEERVKPRDLLEKATMVAPRERELARYMGLLGAGEPEIRMLRWAAGDTFLAGTRGWFGGSDGLSRDAIKASLYAVPDVEAFTENSLGVATRIDDSNDATLVVVRVS